MLGQFETRQYDATAVHRLCTLLSFVYLFLICRRVRPQNTREISVKSVPKIFSA
jgi:hypothetical protein